MTTLGKSKRLLPVAMVALLWGTIIAASRAAENPINYTGHYELADSNAGQTFSLDVTQTGSDATLSFSAAMTDGSSAAPDGDGKGSVDKTGALKFTFKDSFDNEGNGILVHEKDGYHLQMNTTTVIDPRPLRFYGDVLLQKTADKPSPP